MIMSTTNRPSLWRVLTETSRVISTRSHHYLAMSVLFIFPISFATIIYPFLVQTASVHSHYRRLLPDVPTQDSKTHSVQKSQLLIQILYVVFVLLFNLCAIPAITHSTFHEFYDGPVRFISSLKSILVSFFPLIATTFVASIILGLTLFAVGFFMLLAYTGLVLLGFDMSYDNIYFPVFVILIAALLVVLLTYLQIEWYLTDVIVVVESQWGVAPLKRSSYLVKGMRGIVFSTVVFFAIVSGLLSGWYSSLVSNAGRVNVGCTCWLVLQMVVYAGFSTILSLYSLAAKTVLFVYCKAWHGELDQKFVLEYVPLPSDVVNVV